MLGYAVIWSYGEADAPPPLGMSAPPVQEAPVSGVRPQHASPAEALPVRPPLMPSLAETRAPAGTHPPITRDQAAAPETVSTPASPPRTAAAIAPPDVRAEKPRAASAPRDTQTTAPSVAPAVIPSKTGSSAALVSADRPQVAPRALKPPGQEAPKLDVAEAAPARPSVEEPIIALAIPAIAPPPRSVALAPAPAEPATAKVEPAPAAAPTEKESAAQTAVPLAQPALPQVQSESKPAIASTAMVASPEASSNVVALASPPAEAATPKIESAPESPLPSHPGTLGRPAQSSRPAAPPSVASPDHQDIAILRGSRRASTNHLATARAREPQKQKVAALPSGTAAAPTATDAPPILVLRGARYATASAPPPPSPLIAVIRGARPRPILLQHYVQPNALILHIRH